MSAKITLHSPTLSLAPLLLPSSPTDSVIDLSFSSPPHKRRNSLPVSHVSILSRILFLLTCAAITLFGIVLLLRTIPNLSLPTTIERVKILAEALEDYSNGSWEGWTHIVFVLSVIYVWKQAFSVPGAIFLNILAGALYGPVVATLLTSLLTGIGASFAYLIGKFVGEPIFEQHFPEKVTFLRKQVEENKDGLFYYLVFIRMFPLSPWWLLNLASPLLCVPLAPFFFSMVFGSIPYNLACCQAGDILQELTSTADIWQPVLLLKMLLVSILSLVPPFLTRRLKRWNEERVAKGIMVSEMTSV
ncbi:11147_t:CDS:2 [Paraglomus brasilianum]|uniref:11147_t:CDS:1 n=1 Tax=Paraglomus brasilianum TaxID=144538 RepID=A0A9N8YYE9_9GLOM|nr:11147_t:CDS:2 [Paraglomus brasilianum]